MCDRMYKFAKTITNKEISNIVLAYEHYEWYLIKAFVLSFSVVQKVNSKSYKTLSYICN